MPVFPEQPPTEQASPPQYQGAESNLKSWSSRFRDRRLWIGLAAVVAILGVVGLRYRVSPEDRAFGQFWSPIISNSNSILIGVGNNPLYELSHSYEDEYFKNHPGSPYESMGLHPYIPIPAGTTIDGKDLHPAEHTFLTIGDLIAVSEIQYVLAQQNRKLDIRFVNDMTYGDLRQSPTILVGAHNNIWTISTTENLRFGFKGHSAVVDHFNPSRTWTANADRSETYAIVARVLNSGNGKVVFAIGGVGWSGTRAAADFITDPQSIWKLAKSLPKGWQNKSVEVVLHTTVKNQIPGTPDVVAAYSW